jgi:plastocyanin
MRRGILATGHIVFMRPDSRSSAPSPLRAAGVLLVLLALLTACDALGGVGGSPTPDPSDRVQPTPRPTPLPSPPAGAVFLEAANRQYSTAVINAVANVPTVIYFTNNDDQNHNVTVFRNASMDLELFRGETFVGPGVTVIYEVPPLAAGEYYFSDINFPSMHGRFIVR